MISHPAYVVAVFGGAVAGAEAAERLSRQGIYTVVFEQNTLPYGKIEDGLPKWHIKLRDKEEEKINAKLDHEKVFFVPKTRLGRDLDFEEVVSTMGFSAVLLATGAWKDRPLPVEGVDEFVGKGLYYQNPFFHWFNHFHEPDYSGEQYEIPDGTVVIGGGLASIDVVKAVMVLTVGRALEQHGHKVDLFTLEKEGPAKVLADRGLSLEKLGLKGCSLYYRRTAINMPITPIPEGADARRIEKAQQVRQRMISNLQEKYLFRFHECHSPVDKIVADGRLAGLVFQKTEVVDGRATPIPDAFVEVRTPLVISSIGSIPEPIPGVPSRGAVYDVDDEKTGRLRGYEHVFALGNAVTGRGNIKESRDHSKMVSAYVVDDFFAWKEEYLQQLTRLSEENLAERLQHIAAELNRERMLSAEQATSLLEKIRDRQKQVGYSGNFRQWIAQHLPVRQEAMG